MRNKFNADFIAKRKIFFIASIAAILFSFLSTFIFGAELDIEFKGGTMITYTYEGELDADEFADFAEANLDNVPVKHNVGSDFLSGKNTIQLSLISTDGLTSDEQSALSETLKEKFADNKIETGESNSVSPSSGKEFLAKCLVAVAFSSLVIIIYIAVRFKNIGGWLAGLCAIVALVHDCVIVYGVFVVCGMPIDANFMAVVLTILGYSVNDTIVIYDRIRENEGLYRGKRTRDEIVNLSINQSLSRSINTSITTFFAMLAVTIVAMVYGVNSIISFSFPMMIGMAVGTYSSICVATPLWTYLEMLRDKKKANRRLFKK